MSVVKSDIHAPVPRGLKGYAEAQSW